MKPNGLRQIWADNKAALNGWLAIPSSFSAEIMAHQGFDTLTVDLQHGVADYQTAITMLQAVATTSTVPLCRVPWNEPGIVQRMLDAGVMGVICPMVNTRAQAEAFVSVMNYPPKGTRSFGPIRSLYAYGPSYPTWANDEIVSFAMIETREALSNLDDILSVPGLDAVYVGPSDLAASLGYTPRFDPEEPAVVDAIRHIIARVKAHGLKAGIHNGTAAYAKKMIEAGYDLVTVGSDARFVAIEAANVAAAMKDRPAPGASSGTY
ncbi:MAG TPA: aldolase/citrate lyase family protein [Geminicoccus sp.]|jgi:4-hydroxy-2-oxoheptanedioate aldolase|uniref:HpcH/HpaI aldolase family protein n=1 Tax=Geminicoccus sp. TaxID=2024832 RepID=UPI002E37F319|nr:aldolase/citrate lyase family protein [Geminicoccus sp.]HEX2529747.1 aldolase/citrate lyase family protein [Geminicoccus sp.]